MRHPPCAELRFNQSGELTDFWCDDRLASTGGGTMTAMRWSTPLTAYRSFGGVRLASHGEGCWHAPDGEFASIEIEIDEISYNVAGGDR